MGYVGDWSHFIPPKVQLRQLNLNLKSFNILSKDKNEVSARSICKRSFSNHLLSFFRAYHPPSGRMIEVYTTQPGVQFYTGNFLDGTLKGKEGHVYFKHSGFCLETQNWPNAMNQVHFLRCYKTLHRLGIQYIEAFAIGV